MPPVWIFILAQYSRKACWIIVTQLRLVFWFGHLLQKNEHLLYKNFPFILDYHEDYSNYDSSSLSCWSCWAQKSAVLGGDCKSWSADSQGPQSSARGGSTLLPLDAVTPRKTTLGTWWVTLSWIWWINGWYMFNVWFIVIDVFLTWRKLIEQELSGLGVLKT